MSLTKRYIHDQPGILPRSRPLRAWHPLPPVRPQRHPPPRNRPGPVAQLRRREPARQLPGNGPLRLRPRHRPLRPRQQLRPFLWVGRGDLRDDHAQVLRPLPRRTVHLLQGGLRHVARPLRRMGLPQVPDGEPGPEPEADEPRLRGPLLLPSVRSQDPVGGDDAGPRGHRPGRQGTVCRHLQLPARGRGIRL